MITENLFYFVAFAECGCVFASVRSDYVPVAALDEFVRGWLHMGFTVQSVKRRELRKMLKREPEDCRCYIPF